MVQKYLNEKKVKEILTAVKKRKILVIGDLMLDRYFFGRVERISPEAPVPIFIPDPAREEVRVGAAGNVALNIRSLGARSAVIGVQGDDKAGRTIKEKLEEQGVTLNAIENKHSKNSIKTRLVASPYNQQLLRIDEDHISAQPPESVTLLVESEIADSDAVIISDYGKGMIDSRLLDKLLPLIRKEGKMVTVDPKVEHFLNYRGVTSLTPNIDEATAGMSLPSRPKTREEVKKLGFNILEKLKSKSLLITQGADGMTLFQPGSAVSIPTVAREVFDVTGAGDTVIAVFTLVLGSGFSFEEAASFAALSAGVVVGKRGAATAEPDEIMELISRIK